MIPIDFAESSGKRCMYSRKAFILRRSQAESKLLGRIGIAERNSLDVNSRALKCEQSEAHGLDRQLAQKRSRQW